MKRGYLVVSEVWSLTLSLAGLAPITCREFRYYRWRWTAQLAVVLASFRPPLFGIVQTTRLVGLVKLKPEPLDRLMDCYDLFLLQMTA